MAFIKYIFFFCWQVFQFQDFPNNCTWVARADVLSWISYMYGRVFWKYLRTSGVPRGGVWGVQTPPEIPKAHQNRAKLNPIVKIVKNC